MSTIIFLFKTGFTHLGKVNKLTGNMQGYSVSKHRWVRIDRAQEKEPEKQSFQIDPLPVNIKH